MLQRHVTAAFAAASFLALSAAAHARGATPFDSHSAIWDPLPSRPRAAGACDPAAFLGQTGTQSGIAVITEFMKDPAAVSDARGEWIEIKNNLPWRLNLEGWTITDNAGSSHVIDRGGQGLWFFREQRLVLGNNDDMTLNGGVAIDYVWSGFSLTNTSDQIVLLDASGALVDRVDYTSSAPWPSLAGQALALKQALESATGNDDGANWCLANQPLHANTTDTGTPGHMNTCP
jgi:hypothetical protein